MQPLHHRRIMRAAGLEPATHRLKVYCSKKPTELYPRRAVVRAMANCYHHNRVRFKIFFIVFTP